MELANLYAQVFKQLGVDVTIKMNNRKILAALAEICGGADKMVDITVAIDKLDKIGLDKVKEELSGRGLSDAQINTIETYLMIDGTNDEKIASLKQLIGTNETGNKGISELEWVLNYHQNSYVANHLQADFTLARGLNYYTGIIFEVKANNAQMGSIGGGGRYDDLTGTFDVPNIPGVDRIYDVMEELQLFPAEVQTGTQVLFFNLGDAESKAAYSLMQVLRDQGIAAELFHENSKFDKQFKYADKKQIPYAVIIGSKELLENTVVLKNLISGDQQSLTNSELLSFAF